MAFPSPTSRRAPSAAAAAVLAAALAIAPHPAAAAPAAPGSPAAEASLAAIAGSREWRSLLHVGGGTAGGESLVDDPRFFLDPDGKRDPAAELRATIASLRRTDVAGDDHPACRFPARAALLRERLGPEAGIPEPACPAFDAFLAEADPRSVTLVFPVGYSNSPATMFGHTLLRIDSGAESRLLATAVSYAAKTDQSFGPLFAVKGLFGLYDGYYFVNPYYEKITEYSHIESRDIWEYRLDLGREEALRLARHLWELRDLGSRYYFFDENCASNLLHLLEVARPSLRLTERPALWATPVDTLRRVLAAGIVTGAAYRPSRATRLRAIATPLPDAERALAVRIARGEVPPSAVEGAVAAEADRARVLDAAVELHQGAFFARGVERKEYAARLIGILGARSRLPAADYRVPEPARPEEGHGSFLVAAGAALAGGDAALALRLRPVYHGILDPPRGFQEGGAIAFGDTELTLGGGGGARLERFRVIDILSLAPRDRFERGSSWRVAVGFERERDGAGGTRLPFGVTWGAGLAASPARGVTVYALPGLEARAGGAVDGWVAGGFGIGAGLLWAPGDRWRMHLEGSAASLLLGERSDRWRIALGQGLALGRNDALELRVVRDGTEGDAETRVLLVWNRYL